MLKTTKKRESPKHRLKQQKHTTVEPISTTNMPEVPTDILFSHIFPSLPIKSLLSFRSVSTDWSSLIGDPQFAKIHLNHVTQNDKSYTPHKLLLRTSSKGFHSIDYEDNVGANAEPLEFPLKAPHSIELLGSCNGLVCVAVPHKKNGGDSDIVLWNPSTGDHKMLPDCDLPISTFHVLGFGYDPSADDYKMVRVVPDSQFRIDIYSLKSNSWNTILGDAPHNILSRFYTRSRGSCLNGSIYWLLHRSYLSRDSDVIVRFDLKDDKFREVPLPRHLNHRVSTSLKLVGNGVGISKLICDHGSQRRSVEVWRMDENHEQVWTKITTFSPQDCGVPKFMKPVDFLKNGEVLMSYDVEVENHKFILYDPKRSAVLQDFPVHGITSCFQEMTYIESLVSPNLYLC